MDQIHPKIYNIVTGGQSLWKLDGVSLLAWRKERGRSGELGDAGDFRNQER